MDFVKLYERIFLRMSRLRVWSALIFAMLFFKIYWNMLYFWLYLWKRLKSVICQKVLIFFEGPCHPPPGCSLGSSHKGSSLHETGWSTLSISSEILDLTLLLFPRSCHNLRGEACPLRVKRKLVIAVAKLELFFACFIHISTKKNSFETHLCWPECWESFHHLLWT